MGATTALVALWVSPENTPPGSVLDVSPVVAVIAAVFFFAAVAALMGAVVGGMGFGMIAVARRFSGIGSANKAWGSRSRRD